MKILSPPYLISMMKTLTFSQSLRGLFLLHLMLISTESTRGQDAAEDNFGSFAIYAKSAPRAENAPPSITQLPLEIKPGSRIAFIGNTLFERSQLYGHFEAMLHREFPQHRLYVRNLSWSADAIDIQPRPENFADVEQHLFHEKIDVIFAAFGFNESFAGEAGLADFQKRLTEYLAKLKSLAFNGSSAPKIVLVSPIANEDLPKIKAAELNNANIHHYVEAMKNVASEQQIAFVDVFQDTRRAMESPGSDLTTNGCHLNEDGYLVFSQSLFQQVFGHSPPPIDEKLRQSIVDRDRQYQRRYRPLNTFYYTGGRNKGYGYLDFLPAMKSFDQMVANREQRIWDLAAGKPVSDRVDDANVEPMPPAEESRGVNEWLPPADELKAFKVDPRFEVNLFASEEEFPEIANPIQMRWDARGRLWVSTSITYPHIYPGNEPNDRLVILEDTDLDGKADKSMIYADNLHVPLSFELGDGGVYVSEQPELTFLKDTNGDDRVDHKTLLMSGFGTEDSHHALHDFVWSPDGDLIFRESIFHHSQVETPYGPIRQQNSGWFRYTPRSERLLSFGTYPSTNPWGVTFDDWGRHVASHPIFAAAFHSLDPPYPKQHPAPNGLQAYSGTCGHEFVDFSSFPEELQGCFIKNRYKPTNRIEMHRWNRRAFGYEEEYLGDLIFSTNLSFIPVDIQFGPRGDLYICDWYNPVKGHAQYSLRDSRRDRTSGRIWRVVAKSKTLLAVPKISGAPVNDLLDLLKRPEYRIRYLAKRELRDRNPTEIAEALDRWLIALDAKDTRFRHHQTEAMWMYRSLGQSRPDLIRDLIGCDEAAGRAAAVQQLRYQHADIPNAIELLKKSINDPDALVRMEAVITSSYMGTRSALEIALKVFDHPMGEHLNYAVACALGSHTLRPIWESAPELGVARRLKQLERSSEIKEPRVTSQQAQFDSQADLKSLKISCEPERMLFSLREFSVVAGQPMKIVFTNPDATDHNLVFVKPDALAEVGMAANDMAKDPNNASSDFIPKDKEDLILQASPMIGPTRKSKIHVFRFNAPNEPGIYPFVCTYPGHWIIMNGRMIVGRDAQDIEKIKAQNTVKIVKEWSLQDFPELVDDKPVTTDPSKVTLGMQAFLKAQCQQCHKVGEHGLNLGPDLTESMKKLRGRKLLQQILEPSLEIHPKFQIVNFLLDSGKIVSGVVAKEEKDSFEIVTSLLTPSVFTKIEKSSIEESYVAKHSAMPTGLVNILNTDEIFNLMAYLESGPIPIMLHEKNE
jgi:putative heme-binding domain-containing protein